MEFKSIRNTAVVALALTTFGFTSCKKETPAPVKNSEPTAQEIMFEQTFDQAFSIMQALSDGSYFKNDNLAAALGSDCATLTADSSVSPHTLTIDFGTTGCVNSEGRTLYGKIIISNYDVKLRQAGTSIGVTFDNTRSNNVIVNGTATITNSGPNGNGNMVFDVAINATEELLVSGKIINSIGTMSYEFTSGISTATKEDDLLSVSGSIGGNDQIGRHYSATTGTPLTKSLASGCNVYYTAGTLTIDIPTEAPKLYDYGTGACDDIATVTQSGVTTTVSLSQ